MKWVEVCLRNKLIIYICAILLCTAGIISIFLMPVSPFPSINMSDISINLNYPGANAQTVQRQVTTKIVDGLKSIDNIQQITANSQAGSANIQLVLNSGKPDAMLQTQMQVLQTISSSHLPSAVPQPSVQQDKGQSGLVSFIITSDKSPLFKIENFTQSVIVPKLSGFPGTKLWLDPTNPVVKIELEPEAIAAYKLNPVAIAQLLNATYQSNPLGSMEIQNHTYILNMGDSLQRLTQLGNIIVGYQHAMPGQNPTNLLGEPIYLKDVAKIHFEPRSITPNFISQYNGKNAASISLYTTSRADPFKIADAAQAYVAQLKKHLPEGMKIIQTFSMAQIMRASMVEVILTIVISSLLVLLIALVFLGRLKATLIPVFTIPVCLLGAMVIVNLIGFSLNIITLLALVIAVGLVVDDAVVVVENITRHLESGMKKHQAIIEGTSDIALTIIGITSTLLVVYIPIMFSSNTMANFFKPFAITLAAAVFISGIVALTLTPVMSMLLLTDKPLNRYQAKFETLLANITCKYHQALNLVIRFKIISLLVISALIATGIYFAAQLPVKIFPNDPNRAVEIKVAPSPQNTVHSIEQKLDLFKKFYHGKSTAYYQMQINKNHLTGVLDGSSRIMLKHDYLKQSYPFAAEIQQFIKAHHIKNVSSRAQNFSNWWSGYPLSFYVYSNSNIHAINQAVTAITQRMKKSGYFSLVTNQINQPQKQFIFDIDKPKAASLGILQQSITALLSTYYGGYTLNNYFNIQGLSVPIIVQADNQSLTNPKSIEALMIQSPLTQKYYSLADFVTLKTTAKPLMITTLNGQPAVSMGANMNAGYSLGQGIAYVNQLIHNNYPSLHIRYTGNALQYQRGNSQTLLIALMGILCVYFLMTVLFKNLVDPLIIMLTVPFSIVGGAVCLYFIGGSINLYSSLGLITLVGLITKHGILIVQFANQELKKGRSVFEAIFTSTQLRFRPIIMTTLAMVFGALPLVLSSKIFYVSREQLGTTIIGGLLIGTLFSLFIVPLMYVWVKKAEGKG